MCSGQGVPNHENVQYESYPQNAQTVWNFLTNHSDLEGEGNRKPKYVSHVQDSLFFGPYSSARAVYQDIAESFEGADRSLSTQEKQLAIDSTTVYLREEWSGPRDHESSTEGLENMIAQTRTGSSYGPLQILYRRAIDSTKTPDPYPVTNTDTPERLNLYDVVFPLNMRSQKLELRNILGVGEGEDVPAGNWRSGSRGTYEQVLFRMYDQWNPYKSLYEQNVFGFSQDFLPIEESSQ
jgi:hypothetical protein